MKTVTYINPPEKCDTCGNSLEKAITFYDAATVMGPWANMCTACYAKYGRGLGLGRGQQYTRITYTDPWKKTRWVKVDG